MMMSFYILLLALFTACGNINETSKANSSETAPIIDTPEDDSQQSMIVGKFTKEDLQKGPFASWFEDGYNNYEPSPEAMEIIKENIGDVEIVGFIGTWCPDSRRETPQMFKILDEAGYDLSKLTMVGVTRGKSTPENLEEGYNMHRVPTFIFMKDGKEVNRFVEYPVESIEADIAKIVSGSEYNNSYAN